MRSLVACVSGSLFGAGLVISGMTDTNKVQGWLDVFGHWDPTLTFVISGALVPMIGAWALISHRNRSFYGTSIPSPKSNVINRPLIVGSILFGAGWALSGLCPGPAIATLGFGGASHFVFLGAMSLGMTVAPILRHSIDSSATAG
ncbi:MAG: hypothetical protein P8Q92_11905 [Pseudoprimorskyibacter sp.]|nr:hypothetical protein [Pseudoprimorskyibacter sp.]